jgi:hypothetical protein
MKNYKAFFILENFSIIPNDHGRKKLFPFGFSRQNIYFLAEKTVNYFMI